MTWRSSDGYTLIEALASLTLLGLASLLLAVGLETIQPRLAVLDQANGVEDVEAAQDLLRTRIERASPQTVLQTPAAMIDFDGTNDELEFVAPPAQSRGPDALLHYRLYLAGDGDLKLDETSDLTLDPRKAINQIVLLHGVAGVELSYFGANGQPAAAGWASHWQQQAVLPLLVRIRIAFSARDRRAWPTLIVRPAATIDSACVIDVNTGACQGRT
jgi:general secretion pathway protein J